MEKTGIEEVKKLLDILSGDLINILTIDYEKIMMELDDLDGDEKKELLVIIAKKVLYILEMVTTLGIKNGLQKFHKEPVKIGRDGSGNE